MYYPKDWKGPGGTAGPASEKPFESPSDIPPRPDTPPPAGTEWQLQSTTDAQGNQKFAWAPIVIAAVSAIASYAQARQANKPRTGYTDQTTTQSPYMADTIRPDIEAILNFQRQLINQGPNYVGNQRFWPTSPSSPQPGYAPGPMERTDIRDARLRDEAQEWLRENGNPGRPDIRNDPFGPTGQRDKAGAGTPAGAPRGRMFGGWTAEELEADPTRVGKLGESGSRKYAGYQRRQGQMGDLSYLRSVFAATGRG